MPRHWVIGSGYFETAYWLQWSNCASRRIFLDISTFRKTPVFKEWNYGLLIWFHFKFKSNAWSQPQEQKRLVGMNTFTKIQFITGCLFEDTILLDPTSTYPENNITWAIRSCNAEESTISRSLIWCAVNLHKTLQGVPALRPFNSPSSFSQVRLMGF